MHITALITDFTDYVINQYSMLYTAADSDNRFD